MKEMTPVTQEEVFLDWYRSEARREPGLRAQLDAAFGQRTESDRAQLGLRMLRGPLLQHRAQLPQVLPDGTRVVSTILFFDVYRVAWFETEMPASALADATAIQAFAAYNTVRDVASQHPGFQNCTVDLTHRPILLTETQGGRMILADGYHRTAGMLQRQWAAPVKVFLGVCPALPDWAHYR